MFCSTASPFCWNHPNKLFWNIWRFKDGKKISISLKLMYKHQRSFLCKPLVKYFFAISIIPKFDKLLWEGLSEKQQGWLISLVSFYITLTEGLCHQYVTRMFSYINRMSLVYSEVSPVCHSYVICNSLVSSFTMNRREDRKWNEYL